MNNYLFINAAYSSPGPMTLVLDAKNRQVIKGQVKADVKITRYVGGIVLSVNCYLSQRIYVLVHKL